LLSVCGGTGTFAQEESAVASILGRVPGNRAIRVARALLGPVAPGLPEITSGSGEAALVVDGGRATR
jgi:hypothetical protein